jgi:phosphoglucosamine mutase
LINVRVADRGALAEARSVWAAVEKETAGLGGEGRVLLRASGTEPVVRIMVEGSTEAEAKAVAERLAEVVDREIGA